LQKYENLVLYVLDTVSTDERRTPEYERRSNVKKQNYREARKKAGLKPEKAATELEVSLTTLLNWERGNTAPDADKLVLMARAYGVSADYLLALA
jgi:DNA-binding transcriptional regulator YiaG